MKHLFALMLIAVSLVFAGCGTPSATPPTKEAVVYFTFRDTWTVAHSAYQAYCEQAVQGKVSLRDQQDIDRAWNTFRVGFKLALMSAQKDWSAATPGSVAILKDDLITLIRSL